MGGGLLHHNGARRVTGPREPQAAQPDWSAALDAFEADLDAVETALAEQAWQNLPRSANPATPAGTPTPAEQARAETLLRRAAPIEARVRAAMRELDNELADLSAKRDAATSYAQLGGAPAEPPPLA